MISEVFKILGVIIVVGILALVLRQYRPEYSFLLTISSAVIILLVLIENIYSPIQTLKELFSKSGVSSQYIGVVFKALGISYISSFVADICRENGQLSLAAKAELAGKCAIFVLSLPIMTSILEIALGFAEI